MKVYTLLAPGFEITEAMLPIDILKRAGIESVTLSVNGEKQVKASNGTIVMADASLADADLNDGAMLFLPGGMPGSNNLRDNETVAKAILKFHKDNKWLVAVCAAPMVLGRMGLLEGMEATCYPGFEEDLLGAKFVKKTCVRSGHFITGCGAGACFALGREMVAALTDESKADAVIEKMMFGVYE